MSVREWGRGELFSLPSLVVGGGSVSTSQSISLSPQTKGGRGDSQMKCGEGRKRWEREKYGTGAGGAGGGGGGFICKVFTTSMLSHSSTSRLAMKNRN